MAKNPTDPQTALFAVINILMPCDRETRERVLRTASVYLDDCADDGEETPDGKNDTGDTATGAARQGEHA